MNDYRGRVAVVTGASSGIGRRFALDLAAAGAAVTGIARRAELLRDLPAHIACDVGDTAAYEDALRTVEKEHGRVDVLINNAGIELENTMSLDDVTLELYERTFAVNFFAAVAGTLAVLPGMLERGSGVVVNVSSDSGRAPGPGLGAYPASKAALSAFTEGLAFETAPRGVHLHVLYPGWVPTGLGQAAVDSGMPMPPKPIRRTEEQVSRLVLERMGGPLVEINAARLATLAPVARALFPRGYRKGVARASRRTS